jgi:hypothetical protein
MSASRPAAAPSGSAAPPGSRQAGARAPRLSRAHQRLLLCLGWPGVLGVVSISVLHFLRYRLGLDVYWTWQAMPTLAAMALALFPLLAFALLARSRADAATVSRSSRRPAHPT